MSNIPRRNKQLLQGLLNMIKYIQSKYDTTDKTMVEIGSWVGVSSILFAKHFKNVICVEPFIPFENDISSKYNMEDVKKEFYNRITPYENIFHIEHTSKEFFDTVYENPYFREKKGIDFVYIDGNHNYEYVKEDLVASIKHVTYMICGHDYWPKKFQGVVKAVNQVLGKPDKIFSDTSWVWNRKK